MIEIVYTYKQTALLLLTCPQQQRKLQLPMFTVYTHKLVASCAQTMICMQSSTNGVYTYKQSQPSGQGVTSHLMTGLKSLHLVYTYKRFLLHRCLAKLGLIPRHRQPPKWVYPYKYPKPNPALSGVRCILARRIGEQP